ncbi:MAG TPA: hypothetical protein DEP99_02260 [Nitrospiraceae bacterium]|nr:hypothetical protein [Nitrospiraceae bacterium]
MKRFEKVYFMNVKPRLPKKDITCVNCGECIQACNEELGYGNGLFNFSMGNKCIMPVVNCNKKKGYIFK